MQGRGNFAQLNGIVGYMYICLARFYIGILYSIMFLNLKN